MLSQLLEVAQVHLPRDDTAHSGLSPSESIIKQGSAPFPGQSGKVNSLFRNFLVPLDCVTLIIKLTRMQGTCRGVCYSPFG